MCVCVCVFVCVCVCVCVCVHVCVHALVLVKYSIITLIVIFDMGNHIKYHISIKIYITFIVGTYISSIIHLMFQSHDIFTVS